MTDVCILGFRKPVEPTARDFYRNITGEIAPPDILARIAKLPLKFVPWSPELYDECITKQRANFKNIVSAALDLAGCLRQGR